MFGWGGVFFVGEYDNGCDVVVFFDIHSRPMDCHFGRGVFKWVD